MSEVLKLMDDIRSNDLLCRMAFGLCVAVAIVSGCLATASCIKALMESWWWFIWFFLASSVCGVAFGAAAYFAG